MNNWKQWVSGTIVASMLAGSSGCAWMSEHQVASGAVIGTVAGAAVGAGVGAAAGGKKNRGESAAIGAAVGAVAGAAVGTGIGYYLKKKKERLAQVQDVTVKEVPATPAAPESTGTPAEPAKPEHLTVNISAQFLFGVGSSTLRPEGLAKIKELATILGEDQQSKVIVKGYSSSEGRDADNVALSERRANAVRNGLIAERIDPARLTAIGMGSSNPVADNSTEEGRIQNRRVELEIYQR